MAQWQRLHFGAISSLFKPRQRQQEQNTEIKNKLKDTSNAPT